MELQGSDTEGAPRSIQFTGSGGEYFRIWIVNWLLILLTFGIYSAWAKVRRLKYFHQHTRLAGASFDYHGEPMAILKGRVIGLGLLIAYNFAIEISATAALAALVALAILLPLLVRSALRFRLQNSSYRGLRFSFRGPLREAYVIFLLAVAPIFIVGAVAGLASAAAGEPSAATALLPLLAFAAIVPYAHYRLKRYQHASSRYGRSDFSFTARPGQFYVVYLAVALLTVGVVVIAGGLLGGMAGQLAEMLQVLKQKEPDPGQVGSIIVVMAAVVVGLYLLLLLVIAPFFAAQIQNLVWCNTRLGLHRFDSAVTTRGLLWIYLSNFIGVVLTLGLFIPWAAVRLARYRLERMSLLPAGSLEDFIADQEAAVTATGEETVEWFDFDIGF